ncbi:DEKNAAC105106 [Brettanomyces naardenensis]|uniref:Small ribosomal subunit protein mS41 n=1 Tax=Brettanomyces naardenensis TaxID=13370 RepID=A0A448YST8_BRENA|nr:DEKNAAC105106 [Brettanomyces naardenensis]
MSSLPLFRSLLSGSRRNFSSTLPGLKRLGAAVIPEPTEEVPDVNSFLNKIGRQASEQSGLFENDWKKFFSMSSKQMKDEGMETATRRYILDWQERFKKGVKLEEMKVVEKKHGGERASRIYAADKKVKERIKMAQLKKGYRKKAIQEVIERKRWEKLHRESAN